MLLAVDMNLKATARNLAQIADDRQAEVTGPAPAQQLVAEHSWRVQEQVWEDYADVQDDHAATRQRAGVRGGPDSQMPPSHIPPQRAGILVDRHGGGKTGLGTGLGAQQHPLAGPSAKLHEAMWAALEEDRDSISSSDSISGAPLSDRRHTTDLSTGSDSLLSQVWARFCETSTGGCRSPYLSIDITTDGWIDLSSMDRSSILL